jgi:hypothetical protein
VFKSRVLGRTFGPKNEKDAGEWRKLLNEELYNSYSYQILLTFIKSSRLRDG